MAPAECTWKGYSVKDTSKFTDFEVIDFTPKEWEEDDIDISITHCGVCSSDVHTITGGWGDVMLPVIPGHEVIGHAVRVGKNVKDVKVGQRVGVGAQVWSCGECARCKNGNENYCPKAVDTYNSKYPHLKKDNVAHGGYAAAIRCNQHWVMPIPDALDSESASPMLCAGVTVYGPLKRHGAAPGASVGIVGIGGLGHLALQFAKAMGCKDVVAFSSTDQKRDDALKMGATDYVVYKGKEDALGEKFFDFFDLILVTTDVASGIPMGLASTLKVNKRMIFVAMPDDHLPPIMSQDMAGNGCLLGGSHIGSRAESLEMLQLAADKGVKTWVESLPMSKAGEGVKACKENTVRYRTVLKQDIV